MTKKTCMILMVILCLAIGTRGISEGARVTGHDTLVTTTESTPPEEAAEALQPQDTALQATRSAQPQAPASSASSGLPAAQSPASSPAAQQAEATGTPSGSTEEDQYITIDFDNVDIRVFVKFISELTGKNFVIEPNVRANVTIMSPRKISVKEAWRVFESVLEVHGFTTVPAGDVIKIVPSSTAREKSVETLLMDDAAGPEDRVVTQIVSLHYANPVEMQKVLAPLVSRASIIIAYQPTGMLIINDVLSNIRRLLSIIEVLDIAGIEEQISVIPLNHARAEEVAASLNQVFQTTRRPQAGVVEGAVKIIADPRTNVVIVLASEHETARIGELVALLDREVPRRADRIRVYRLQNAEAETLSQVLMNIPRKSDQQGQGEASGAALLSRDLQIIPDKSTNSLIITADLDDYIVLEEVIGKLDIPRPMVYIEALIMEVNVDRDFKLGTEWTGGEYISSSDGRTKVYGGGFRGPGIIPSPDAGGVIRLPEGFSLGVLGQTIKIGDFFFPNLGAVFQAYHKDQDVHILSTPQLLTLDNEEAEIYVGENIPYQTRADVTDALRDYSTYEYRDVGVTLRITPQINQERFVRLNIYQEITKLSGQEAAQTDRPSTLKRTATTTVTIQDKNTIVIGGLIGDDVTTTTWQVPLLGRIPLLGWLFRHEAERREKRNLFIFLTPHIVENPLEAGVLYTEKRERIETLEGATIRSKRLRQVMGDD